MRGAPRFGALLAAALFACVAAGARTTTATRRRPARREGLAGNPLAGWDPRAVRLGSAMGLIRLGVFLGMGGARGTRPRSRCLELPRGSFSPHGKRPRRPAPTWTDGDGRVDFPLFGPYGLLSARLGQVRPRIAPDADLRAVSPDAPPDPGGGATR